MQPELVKNVVTKVVQEIQEERDRKGDIVEIWQRAMGKKISRHTKPVSFKSGTLIVNVDRTSWLYELNLCKPLLVRRLKKRLSVNFPLRELRFRIGGII